MLLTVVNDILDLATVDAGIMQLEISEVRIDQTVSAAAALVADRLDEHSIRLAVDTAQAPYSFHADETRVRQILYNLLSNAVNYAPEGSTVKLSCRKTDAGWSSRFMTTARECRPKFSTPCSGASSRASMAAAAAVPALACRW